MIKLKEMVLRGFKSFKKETVIPFQTTGITAIVGENGSGKSNLVDALTFVMGQRSSQLRAQRLEQLIYNGGENGTPAQQARVTLKLDNPDGEFDEYLESFLENGRRPDSVSIGRKVTSSSSTYKFMGKTCKRSLINDLLEKANIDPSRHHIVNQGKITEIINKRPSERREIVDELAGINKYEEKKQQAIEDLREVKQKLMTNRVILGERKGQLTRLRKEREAALEYQSKEKELDRVEQSIVYRKRQNKLNKLEEFNKKHHEIATKVEELDNSLSELDKETEQKERTIRDLRQEKEDDSHAKLRDEVEDLKMEIVKRRGEVNSTEKEIENLKETIEELKKLKQKQTKSSGRSKNRAVKALLKRDRGGIYGTVEGLLEVPADYVVAIETAAGGHLHDLVVDSRSTAIEAVNYLKKNNLGRARLLPLMKISSSRRSPASKKARSLNGVIDYAIELVDFNSKYRRALEYVFRDTLIAENLEAVENVENVRVVTLDGDVLSRGGAISGGTSKKSRSSKGNDKTSEIQQKIKSKQNKVDDLYDQLGDKREELQKLSRKLEKKEEQLSQQSQANEETKEKIQSLESELDRAKKDKRQTYRKLEKTKSRNSDLEKKIDSLNHELKDLNEVDEELDHIDEPVKDLIERKRTIRRELDRLQPVNMKSIDEYKEFKQEVDELEGKMSQLREEKREVERLIGEIEHRKQQQFYQTLEQLSEEFERIFQILFEGGSAHLELKREDDIESGLLIKAHPPGKELHVLDSLSGGEKSLTAISFIFALQELNPSPIYVLDEIDAALDQRRSKMLAELLQGYAEQAQLIMISHNQETAKHADRVFGVTMRDSRSEVLSLQLT